LRDYYTVPSGINQQNLQLTINIIATTASRRITMLYLSALTLALCMGYLVWAIIKPEQF